MTNNKGVIYILTNPSFPEYVKIGYAKDVKSRVNTLNSSSAVPYAFRVYATYEVDSQLSDKKVHAILDKLNPDLRSRETIDGKSRVREFYAMSPEDAYSIFEAIAEINGHKDRLKKYKATKEEANDEKQAIETRTNKRPNFDFSLIGIKPGEKVEYFNNNSANSGTLCTVVDNKKVEYDGQVMSLTALAKLLSENVKEDGHIPGPAYFKYKGEWLNDLRKKFDV